MSDLSTRSSQGPLQTLGLEQRYPEGERIIADRLAPKLLRGVDRFYFWLAGWPWLRDRLIALNGKAAPGIWALFACRKRFIEEQLDAALNQGVSQLINLGAGFDTLAYRHPRAGEMTAWEIDVQSNIDAKRARISAAMGSVPSHVHLLPVDFDTQPLSEATQAAGCTLDVPTFFVMEAVTQYLTEDGIRSTLEFLAGAAPTSRLVLTYTRQDFIDGEELHGLKLLHRMVMKNGTWKWGSTEAELRTLLERYGWEVVEHHGSDELAARFVPRGRALASTPIEPIVLAMKR